MDRIGDKPGKDEFKSNDDGPLVYRENIENFLIRLGGSNSISLFIKAKIDEKKEDQKKKLKYDEKLNIGVRTTDFLFEEKDNGLQFVKPSLRKGLSFFAVSETCLKKLREDKAKFCFVKKKLFDNCPFLGLNADSMNEVYGQHFSLCVTKEVLLSTFLAKLQELQLFGVRNRMILNLTDIKKEEELEEINKQFEEWVIL